jgi:hypothetical protein
MRFFKELFKSKAAKEADAIIEEWRSLLGTAVQQLKSSKYNYDQSKRFLELFSGRNIRNWIPSLKILVSSNLSDGSPVLSKFFIREVPVTGTKNQCLIAIHDTSILESIKQIGFGNIKLGGPNEYEKDVRIQSSNGIYLMEFYDDRDTKRIVEKCNQYYDALLRVKDRLSSREVICVPKYTWIEWRGGDFIFETELTPSRVDEIVAALPSDCKYLNEYREYLIEKLAEASISTSSVGVRKVKTVAYNQPVVYCWTYSKFEKRHIKDLDYQAKNEEFESVISEIREAAQKKIETVSNG